MAKPENAITRKCYNQTQQSGNSGQTFKKVDYVLNIGFMYA
jgi:hypothetical protein